MFRLLFCRKEEYMSRVGLAMLFDRAGGSLTETIREEIKNVELKTNTHKKLIREVREEWDEWDLTEEQKNDDCLEFDSFYNGFMAPYFGCYRCEDTRQGLQAIDMDSDGKVDWSEFLVYLKWALHQYPEINTKTELIDIAFRKGLVPAMRDEVVGANTQHPPGKASRTKTPHSSGIVSRASTQHTSDKVSTVSTRSTSVRDAVSLHMEEVKIYDIE